MSMNRTCSDAGTAGTRVWAVWALLGHSLSQNGYFSLCDEPEILNDDADPLQLSHAACVRAEIVVLQGKHAELCDNFDKLQTNFQFSESAKTSQHEAIVTRITESVLKRFIMVEERIAQGEVRIDGCCALQELLQDPVASDSNGKLKKRRSKHNS
jgi:hypothetical protein